MLFRSEIPEVVSTAEAGSGPSEFVGRAGGTGPQDAHEEDPLPRLERVHPEDLDGRVVIEEHRGDDALSHEDLGGHLDRHSPEWHGYT